MLELREKFGMYLWWLRSLYRAVERLEAQKRAREQAARQAEQAYEEEEVVWGGLILDDGTVWDSQLDDAVPLEEYQRTHPGFRDPNKRPDPKPAYVPAQAPPPLLPPAETSNDPDPILTDHRRKFDSAPDRTPWRDAKLVPPTPRTPSMRRTPYGEVFPWLSEPR